MVFEVKLDEVKERGKECLCIDYPVEGQRDETLFRGTLQHPKLITAGASSLPGIITPAEEGESLLLLPLPPARMLRAIISRDNKTDS